MIGLLRTLRVVLTHDTDGTSVVIDVAVRRRTGTVRAGEELENGRVCQRNTGSKCHDQSLDVHV